MGIVSADMTDKAALQAYARKHLALTNVEPLAADQWVGGGEVRITDPTTGGMKGAKLARFSLIPFDFLRALAEHYGKGAQKYDDNNWRKGYKWSLTLDAMLRHLEQWLGGEDNDQETGTNHLVAVAWHVIALWWFQRHGKGTDDIRPTAAAPLLGSNSPRTHFSNATHLPSTGASKGLNGNHPHHP